MFVQVYTANYTAAAVQQQWYSPCNRPSSWMESAYIVYRILRKIESRQQPIAGGGLNSLCSSVLVNNSTTEYVRIADHGFDPWAGGRSGYLATTHHVVYCCVPCLRFAKLTELFLWSKTRTKKKIPTDRRQDIEPSCWRAVRCVVRRLRDVGR